MDHMMSGMDGVEAMKRIRTDVSGLNGSVPVIALTANAMSSAKQMFLAEGFDGFVSKPVEIDELERVLKQVLPKSFISFVDADGALEAAEEEPEVPVIRPAEEKDFISEFRKSGIDTDAGIKYCVGDKEFYKSLLLQFASEAPDKIASMKNYYQIRDWHNYEILVHALKSTSKMIGVSGLSDKAKALEKAAKENDEGFILANHETMLKDYGKITAEVRDMLMSEENGSTDDEVLVFNPEENGGDKV